METLDGELTFLSKNEEKKIKFCSDKRKEIVIGSNVISDIRLNSPEIEDTHLKIYKNENGKVIIHNLSKEHPILVNGEIVNGKRFLKSGEVITIADKNIRWELRSDAKRRTAALTKEERKILKHKFLKINKRITVHNVNVESFQKTNNVSPMSTTEESSSGESPVIPAPTEEKALDDPVNELNSSIPAVVSTDKENEKTPSKSLKLNLSGVLQTTYTPPGARLTRSVSKTPYNTPLKTPAIKSASKNILNCSLNVQRVQTPVSAKRHNSSMHLIDLTTPFLKRTDSTSTPKSIMSVKKTPKTIGKTPLRTQILLKSALKNSSVKNNVSGVSSNVQPKVLFESPAQDSLSIIEVSSCSSANSSKISYIESSRGSSIGAQEIQKESSNDDVKDLLENISSVLDENKDEFKEPPSKVEDVKETTIEKKFNEIVEQQKDSVCESSHESLFEKALNNVPIEAIENFDKLVEDDSSTSSKNEGDPEKKAEIVLKMIEDARESLSVTEANKTTQVLSSRYSNVTPNDSIVDSVANSSQKYDATTPKLSILDAVMSVRKSDLDGKLTKSPVSRLSLANDATETVENYQLNTNIPKSLRSTRKRIGTAMASLHNSSQVCDTTFDMDESLNTSSSLNKESNEMSQVEGSNILSLDNQPELDSSNKENEYTETAANNSIVFYEYSETDDNNQESKVIFEISNEENNDENMDVGDDDSESSSSEEEEEEEEDDIKEPENDEYVEEEYLDDTAGSNTQVVNKFRLSEQDLEEEGIDIMELSKGEDQLEAEIDEIPATQQIDDNMNGTAEKIEHEEIPETQDFESIDTANDKTFELPQETQSPDLPVENEQIESEKLHESAVVEEPKNIGESQGEDPTDDHVEIPATQAFDIEDDLVVKEEEKSINMSESKEGYDSIVELSDTVVNSQEVNKSDTAESISIQEISDTTASEGDICSQEVRKDEVEEPEVKEFSMSQDIIESSQEECVVRRSRFFTFRSNELVNKSVVEDACVAQESGETIKSLDTNDSETINELIATPSDILTDLAAVQSYSSSDMYEGDVSLPPTQEMSDDQEDETLQGDSAIESSNKIDDQSNEEPEQKNVDDSVLHTTQTKSRESVLFSDTEFSGIDINNSMLRRIDSDDFNLATQIFKEPNNEQQDTVESEEKDLASKEVDVLNDDIQKELEEVDFERKIPERAHSILPSEIQKSILNRKTMIPEALNESFEQFIGRQKNANDDNNSEIVTTEKDNNHKNEEQQEMALNEESLEKEYDDEIEEELARMNEEPSVKLNKERPKSMLPAQDDEIMNSEFSVEKQSSSSRMTIIPSDDIRKKSFLEDLEQEKMDIVEKQSKKISEEEKPIIEQEIEDVSVETSQDDSFDKNSQSPVEDVPIAESQEEISEQEPIVKEEIEEVPIETSQDDSTDKNSQSPVEDVPIIESQEEISENEPIVEEPCIKKHAYVTTEIEKQAQETPSRRRVARVNYSELATGSPARSSRRARSASTESNNGKKDDEPVVKHLKMEPIVEDDITLQITVTATQNVVSENKSSDSIVHQETTKPDENDVLPMHENSSTEAQEISNIEEEKEISRDEQQVSEPDKVVSINENQAPEISENIVTDEVAPNTEVIVDDTQKEMPENVNVEKETTSEVSLNNTKDAVMEQAHPEISSQESEVNEEAVEEMPSQKEPPAENEPKSANIPVVEPQTPSRKRAKKLNYLELASGSPARTPRRARQASTEEKSTEQAKSSKIVKQAAIAEEDSTKDEEQQEEEPKSAVKTKSSGRARKIDQVNKNVEEESTPLKRTKRGTTPAKSTVAPEPKKRGRKVQEKVVEKESENIETSDAIEKATPSEEITKNESPKVEPKKRGRKAQEKIVEEIEESEKIEAAKVITISSEESDNKKEEPVKRGRGRQPKVVNEIKPQELEKPEESNAKPAKRVRGKQQKVEETQQQQDEKSEQPAKKGRSRKLKNEVTEEKATDELPQKETVVEKKGRGRKAVEVPQVEETTAKSSKRLKKDTVDNNDAKDEKEEINEQPIKKRGRAAKDVETVPEKDHPVVVKKGRKAKNEEVVPEKSEESAPKRGTRKGKAEIAHETVEQEAPKTSSRVRKQKNDDIPVEVNKNEEVAAPKRGRGKKQEVAAEIHEEPKAPTKTVRGRKNTVEEEAPKQPEIILVSSQSTQETEKAVPVKKGRGRQAKIVDEKEKKTDEKQPEEVQSPKRGRKVEKETSEQPAAIKGRTRQPSKSESEHTKSPPTRRNIAKHVTIVTPSSMPTTSKQKEVVQEPVVVKRATKRQAPKTEEPVATKRSTRAKK